MRVHVILLNVSAGALCSGLTRLTIFRDKEFSLLLQHVNMALENMFARRNGICSTECRLGAALQVGAGEVDSAHAQAQLAECQGRGL